MKKEKVKHKYEEKIKIDSSFENLMKKAVTTKKEDVDKLLKGKSKD